jgi:hypothetical protein
VRETLRKQEPKTKEHKKKIEALKHDQQFLDFGSAVGEYHYEKDKLGRERIVYDLRPVYDPFRKKWVAKKHGIDMSRRPKKKRKSQYR